jgi:midasin
MREFQLLSRMVTFSERLESAMTNLEFGYKGGPFEANLRDILRWCKLVTNEKTGFDVRQLNEDKRFELQDLLLVLLEKMKPIYCQRMRSESDVSAVLNIFGAVFECDVEALNQDSKAVSFYWNDTDVFFNDIQWSRIDGAEDKFNSTTHKHSIILSSQVESLKNVVECVMMEKPVILCGSSDCGKTKIIDTFCSIFNKNLYLDTIDDSVTGSFQQFDFNRMLEDMWQQVQVILFEKLSEITLSKTMTSADLCNMTNLFKLWRTYDSDIGIGLSANSELETFCKRVDAVKMILVALMKVTVKDVKSKICQMEREVMMWQKILQKSSNVLNSGGRFEWVDSVVVKSI